MRELYKLRTTDEARLALANFCRAMGPASERMRVHIFTIPVDRERDADCILSDVITERDQLRAERDELREALIWMSGSADFGPGGKAEAGFSKIRHLLAARDRDGGAK